ncbi:hypothetical protein D8674_021880 [Pyrus ussuriensis x Pyrus communis]|uniref:Uncharacterized protein n=1 Tax=Pyrus ussuriensis x Pyrus communis TaxID=2448454 RepID=A0A5N5GNT3_9ROSA|nr:hypothetical protein D8674_021880 [Pyrus ussuriensis x Pyrus communis]
MEEFRKYWPDESLVWKNRPEGALSGFDEVVRMEPEKAEWLVVIYSLKVKSLFFTVRKVGEGLPVPFRTYVPRRKEGRADGNPVSGGGGGGLIVLITCSRTLTLNQ